MQLDSIKLGSLEWVDEYGWDAVAQETDRSVSGVFLVQGGQKKYGRPITLRSNSGEWTPLSVVRQLEPPRDSFGRVMVLRVPDGREFHVIFNRDEPPLEAQPLFRHDVPDPDHLYEVAVRLITVEPKEESPTET